MPKPKHILIVAGDASADHYGAELVKALRKRHPDSRTSALGGTHLQAVVHQFLFPLVSVGGFGFWEPIMKLPQLWKAKQAIKKLLATDPPDVVIPMDYYGFNIHAARWAHAQKIPVVYYISPQVWASRPHRLQELKKVITHMLVLFPFEAELYRGAGIPVSFVGHPLMDLLPQPSSPAELFTIGLLPGSRRAIVQRHLPLLVQTAAELRKMRPELQFILFRPDSIEAEFYQSALRDSWIQLLHDPRYEQRRKLSLAVGVSGTTALENTLLGIPMVVMYRLSALSYQIARQLIRIPYVAIPNILADKALVPELLQEEATPLKLAAAAQKLIDQPEARKHMREALLALREQQGPGGASERAAEEISRILETSAPPRFPQRTLTEAVS